MPFSPITVNTKTFNASGPAGRYMLSTVGYGSPLDYFKIVGGKKNSAGFTTATVSRVQEKLGADNVIYSTVVSVPMTISPIATPTEVDVLVSDISEFVTQAILNRILMGES